MISRLHALSKSAMCWDDALAHAEAISIARFKMMGRVMNGPLGDNMQHCVSHSSSLETVMGPTGYASQYRETTAAQELPPNATKACHEQILTWVKLFSPKLLKHLAACAAHTYMIKDQYC